MKLKIKGYFASLLGFTLWAASTSFLYAADERVPWCDFDARHFPNGIVLKLDDRWFRTCGPWSEQVLERVTILVVNPAAVPGLENRYAAQNLRLSDRLTKERRRDVFTQPRYQVGERQMGPVTYKAYNSYLNEGDTVPVSANYFYEPIDNTSPWPEHWVACSGENRRESGGSEACRVFVWPTDRISASLIFHSSRDRKPMPCEYFAFFAREITKVLAAADVTDRLQEFEGKLDFIE